MFSSYLRVYERYIRFITCALVTSTALYISFFLFYHLRAPEHVTESIGAFCAALLFSLFGVGAFLVLFFVTLFCYWFINNTYCMQDHAERIVACCSMVLLVDAFCANANVGLSGFFGSRLQTMFAYFFNTQELYFVLCYLFLISCVLATRFFNIPRIIAWCHSFKQYVRLSAHYFSVACTTLLKCVQILLGISKQTIHRFLLIDETILLPDDYQLVAQQLALLRCADAQHFQTPVQAASFTQSTAIEYETPTHFEDHYEPSIMVQKSATRSMQKEYFATKSGDYQLPPVSLFAKQTMQINHIDAEQLSERAMVLEEKLEKFGIFGSVVSIKSGPVVALFEYQPRIDIKISKILALEDDLALALQALSIRIIAPIPGTSVVGFEVAHKKRVDVPFSALIASSDFLSTQATLPIVLGKDTVGGNVIADLARMPHLLMAGSTGSGKSVALNCILTSLLCRFKPDELRLVLIDPKRLEFAPYADIAHLLFPVVTDPKKVSPVLRWIIGVMEERYELMAAVGVRNIHDYNKVSHIVQHNQQLPFIVLVIDELADLMITTGREIEDLIARIAQMARAAGIHLIVATQRPSVDVITGLIKVNFPSRISFRVASKVDSRIILDDVGADKLLGRGDMLFFDANGSIKRVHGTYLTDEEIEKVGNFIRKQLPPNYQTILTHADDATELSADDEELYKQTLMFLETLDEVSISLLQRKFKIGFNRSARLIETLESQGKIMPSDGGKPRKIVR